MRILVTIDKHRAHGLSMVGSYQDWTELLSVLVQTIVQTTIATTTAPRLTEAGKLLTFIMKY